MDKVVGIVNLYRKGFKEYQIANEELHEDNVLLRQKVEGLQKGKSQDSINLEQLNQLVEMCQEDFSNMRVYDTKKRARNKK